MNKEEYLRQVLEGQNLTSNQLENLRNLRNKVESQIREGMRGNPRVLYAGSYGKNTIISASYDLDIVLIWSSEFNSSLKNIYSAIGGILQENWNYPRSKRVGWEIHFEGDFHIDVIPGKTSSKDPKYEYLYNSKSKGRFQTSIEIHMNIVKKSKRRDVLRLMKLWKKRKNVPIKTFILEQMVIDGCKSTRRDTLEPQMNAALNYIEDNIQTLKVYDPANSNYVVSNNISIEQKNRIKKLASQALGFKSWGEVFL